jgi:hypothetical protein
LREETKMGGNGNGQGIVRAGAIEQSKELLARLKNLESDLDAIREALHGEGEAKDDNAPVPFTLCSTLNEALEVLSRCMARVHSIETALGVVPPDADLCERKQDLSTPLARVKRR